MGLLRNMPKRLPSQKGGRLPDGSPNKSPNPKISVSHALTKEVVEAIAKLPQIQSREWSKSYLAEQLWRNYLGLSSDYSVSDLDLISKGEVIE